MMIEPPEAHLLDSPPISERRQMTLLERRFDHAPVFIRALDGTIVHWTGGAAKLFGYSRDEALGQHASVLLRTVAPIPEREIIRIISEDGEWIGELSYRHRLGYRIITNSTWNLERTSEGAHIVETHIDITEQRRTEERYREAQKFYRLLIDALPQLVWTATMEGKCDFVSTQFTAYCGAPIEAHLGDAWLDFVHPDDRERAVDAWRKAISLVLPTYDVIFRLRHHSGEYRWFKVTGVPMRDESGSIMRWFGTCTDIHDLARANENNQHSAAELETLVAKRTEDLAAANNKLVIEIAEREQAQDALRQAQKMEAVGHLTGGIAHDFNNLLTVIVGNIELARERVTDNRMDRLLSGALKAAARGEKLTGQLLAFSRKQRLNPRVICLNAAVREMTDLIGRSIGQGTRVNFEIARGSLPCETDPSQLQSALLNVIINAKDALVVPASGRITVRTGLIDLTAKDGVLPGPYAMVSVTDNGIGMTPAVKERAFEPFFTTKDVGQGSGLGLSQVYGFAKQLGGQCTIQSDTGRGTTISIYLPLSDKPLTVAKEPRKGLHTVLVVEDDEQVREMAVTVIEELGYEVLCAPDGPTACALLKEKYRDIDVLFTDIVMPNGMNGFEVARSAREISPSIRVVFTSGYAESIGFNEDSVADSQVLAKPYRPGELQRELREALTKE